MKGIRVVVFMAAFGVVFAYSQKPPRNQQPSTVQLAAQVDAHQLAYRAAEIPIPVCPSWKTGCQQGN